VQDVSDLIMSDEKMYKNQNNYSELDFFNIF
jgi:hypothetical protein